MKTNNIKISVHEKKQCIKRFDLKVKANTDLFQVKRLRRAERMILGIVGCGVKLIPKDGIMKLLNNKCVKAEYFMYRNKIAVLAGDTVTTVYDYEKNKFKGTN